MVAKRGVEGGGAEKRCRRRRGVKRGVEGGQREKRYRRRWGRCVLEGGVSAGRRRVM